MEPVRSLNSVLGSIRVNERNAGGNKREAEAFRRALEQETGDSKRDGEGKPGRETPVRSPLQQKAAADRRDEGTPPRHVDVIA